MNQTVNCTGRAFADLTDPYTGRHLDTKMLVTARGPRFFAPTAYSTAQRFSTREAAYNAWAMSEGVADVRKGQPITCAYTGRMLTLRHDETGYWFEGGFDPRRFYTRSEFLHYAAMRGGVSKYPAPSKEIRVDAVREPAKPVRTHEPAMHEEMQRVAHEVAGHIGAKRTTKVRVSRGSGR